MLYNSIIIPSEALMVCIHFSINKLKYKNINTVISGQKWLNIANYLDMIGD